METKYRNFRNFVLFLAFLICFSETLSIRNVAYTMQAMVNHTATETQYYPQSVEEIEELDTVKDHVWRTVASWLNSSCDEVRDKELTISNFQ